MNIVKVTKKKELDALYEDSALTIEGLAEESFGEFLAEIDAIAGTRTEDIYLVSGATMNRAYGLTGHNRYPARLNIVCYKLSDMQDVAPMIVGRFNFGGRWFSDVVDDNLAGEIS